jgi:hypothetical protein
VEPTNTNAPNFVNAPGLSASTTYYGTAISADGKYILICKGGTSGTAIFFSSNKGVSFAALPSSSFSTSTNWQCCAMSSTGQIMVVAGLSSNIYKSTDYGASWTPIGSVFNWISLHLSYTGQYCLATRHTNVLYSSGTVYSTVFNNFLVNNTNTEYTTFTVTGLNRGPQSAYVSQSGKYMIVTSYAHSQGIAISTNYGSTWSTSNYNIASSGYQYWQTAITYDETKIYITLYSGPSVGVWILPITGETIGNGTKISSYAALTGITGIQSIAISRDGTYIIITSETKTYYSQNSGATWLLAYTGPIQYMSMSEGGRTVITTDYSSSIPQISKT